MYCRCSFRFKSFITFLFLFLPLSVQAVSESVKNQVTDRWMEIDLYWFDKAHMQNSVDAFWTRYYPLVKNVSGYKGVILNTGWVSQYILEWNGDLNKRIKFPKEMRTYSWFADKGALTGNTTEQMNLWKHRFATADAPQVVAYDAWTYGDLKKLVALLKRTAVKKYGLEDVKIGSLVFGGSRIYNSEKMDFEKRHPNIFRGGTPNFLAKLSGDDVKYGAYPQGIPDGTPMTEFFGKQWGDLSHKIGLDAIVLRDGFLGVAMYSRSGPYGRMAPDDPKVLTAWSEATADLVRQTKMSNPKAWVIGYSNAASAVGDWRSNCFDLEKIAEEGYLDAWIDQTWAGAWNEVGQRPGGMFWNRQELGWTYQLAFVLGHAALLANSKVRHYVLTETYDAWESWNVIHCAKERLRWGIWAYSHAAVKTPKGLKMPAGNYISWMNKGKSLLSEKDVSFLAQTSDEAFADARKTTEILGPTMVYCRSAMEWQSAHQPDQTIKEWIDDQVGSLSKWSVPVLSITRTEYLPKVESELFILQTPVHMKAEEKTAVCQLLKSGKPVAVFGSPVGGVDSDVLKILGVSTAQKKISHVKSIGCLAGKTGGIYAKLPNTFPLYQVFSRNSCSADAEVIYEVEDSPVLVRNQSHGKRTIFWDPPELACNVSGVQGFGKSLDVMLGSPIPYALTARLFNETLKTSGSCFVENINPYAPVNLLYWKTTDDSLNVLVGNLEEGINHRADQSVSTVMRIPSDLLDQSGTTAFDVWNGSSIVLSNGRLPIALGKGGSGFFKMKCRK